MIIVIIHIIDIIDIIETYDFYNIGRVILLGEKIFPIFLPYPMNIPMYKYSFLCITIHTILL